MMSGSEKKSQENVELRKGFFDSIKNNNASNFLKEIQKEQSQSNSNNNNKK
jgi:hypothetical protein